MKTDTWEQQIQYIKKDLQKVFIIYISTFLIYFGYFGTLLPIYIGGLAVLFIYYVVLTNLEKIKIIDTNQENIIKNIGLKLHLFIFRAIVEEAFTRYSLLILIFFLSSMIADDLLHIGSIESKYFNPLNLPAWPVIAIFLVIYSFIFLKIHHGFLNWNNSGNKVNYVLIILLNICLTIVFILYNSFFVSWGFHGLLNILLVNSQNNTEKFTKSTKLNKLIISIFFSILFSLTIFFGIRFFNLKSIYTNNLTNFPKISQPNNYQEKKSDNIYIFHNETIGIEFEYPVDFGNPKIEYLDANPSTKKIGMLKGKTVDILFYPDIKKYNLEYLRILAVTNNFSRFLFREYTGLEKIEKYCNNYFTYDEKGNICIFRNINGINRIVENELFEDEGLIFLSNNYKFKNLTNSEYSGINFHLVFKDVNDKIKKQYSCCKDLSFEERNKNTYDLIKIISKNIITKTNLSESEINAINIIEKIISSIKFIEN